MVWQRHAFTVTAESEAEADRIIRENELNQECITDVDDTRIVFENTETLFDTQSRIEPDENGGRHTLEVLTADKQRSVCTNADNRLSEGSEPPCIEPAERKMLSPQEQVKNIIDKLIADLCYITERPNDWLPHTVYVEEIAEDERSGEIPIYTRYVLEDYTADGNCTFYNPQTDEHRSGYLDEINIDWLVTVWNRYRDLCVEQGLWREQAIHLLERRRMLRCPTFSSSSETIGRTSPPMRRISRRSGSGRASIRQVADRRLRRRGSWLSSGLASLWNVALPTDRFLPCTSEDRRTVSTIRTTRRSTRSFA